MSNSVFVALICSAALLSCSIDLPSVQPNQHPTGKEAFIYGRFKISGNLGENMALVMRCDDGREYRIPFDREAPLAVLAVAPSTCELEELLYLDALNAPLGKTPFPRGVLGRIRLHAGRAYYLGDYRGEISHGSFGEFNIKFEVREWRDEFQGTTQDLREHFPYLRGSETINQLLGVERARVDRRTVDPE